VQKQTGTTQTVNFVGRLDVRALDLQSAKVDSAEIAWPPADWRSVRFDLSRKDVNSNGEARRIDYEPRGPSNLSLASLSAPFYSAYGSMQVVLPSTAYAGPPVLVPPHPVVAANNKDAESPIRFVDGNLLMSRDPIENHVSMPDTSLVLVVRHPGTIIEKGIWQAVLFSIFFLIMLVALFVYLFNRTLLPMLTLSRQSRQLVLGRNVTNAKLSYADRTDEVGVLASSFNALLAETKLQTEREHQEATEREEESRKGAAEQVRARGESLRIIGHEIRAPLQALIALHPAPADPSLHYINKILRAINHIFSSKGPEAAFDSMPIVLETIDIAPFLRAFLLDSAQLIGVPNLTYSGPMNGVHCEVDQNALEDTITHLLNNARVHGTLNGAVSIGLTVAGGYAVVSVANEGPLIPPDQIDRVFDPYFSGAADADVSSQGLGLYAAKNYVSRMRGNIEIHNTSTGVEVKITLPLFPTGGRRNS
jgi:signal transduction histidine kinase